MRTILRFLFPELAIWVALMTLLTTTVVFAYVPLGTLNIVVSLAIATAKAGLVALFFMELRVARGVIRLAAAAGPFWLLILFVLTLSDALTR